jgi:UDP-2-acetamido-3-amino-2,3-dideoxy-glucuronate N-acetyltransferase
MSQDWRNDGITHYIADSAQIGYGTRVWHFAVVLDDVVIGNGCSIGSGAEIGRGTKIGNYTRIGAHVFLPPNSVIGDKVFISPGVICCDDRFPRSMNPGYLAEPPIIEDGASIGAGSVLLPGVRIGECAMIGAGSIVTKDVGDLGFVRCEQARAFERTF